MSNSTATTKFKCEFCDKLFSRENSLVVHMCEQKRRRQERHERGVELGLQAYLRFYETTQGSSRLKSWEDFVTSPYYRAFVKFGRYCINIKAINPPRFMDWLLKHNKKIDKWTSDSIYTEYVIDYLASEQASDALERAVKWAEQWSEKNNASFRDCLRYGNSNVLCHAVVTGRLSPWVIYNCQSGQDFLDALDPKQIEMIWPYIDSDRWQKIFRDYPADQAFVENVMRQTGW